MLPLFKLKTQLAANAAASPEDVIAAKTALQNLGLYEAPEWGVSKFPDHALFDAIKAFQNSQGLRVDGVMKPGGESESVLQAAAELVRSHGRNGDTVLAHITPAEANLLDQVTDGGSINPVTGLPEFYETMSDGGFDYSGDIDGANPSQNADVNDNDTDDDGMLTDWSKNSNYKGEVNTSNPDSGTSHLLEKSTKPKATIVNKEQLALEKSQKQVQQQQALAEKHQKEEEERETLGANPYAPGKNAPSPSTPEQISELADQERSLGLSAPVLDWGPMNPYWSPGLNPAVTPPAPQPPTPNLEKNSKASISLGARPGAAGAAVITAVIDRYVNDREFREMIDRNAKAFTDTRSGFDPTDFGGGPGPGSFGGAPSTRRR